MIPLAVCPDISFSASSPGAIRITSFRLVQLRSFSSPTGYFSPGYLITYDVLPVFHASPCVFRLYNANTNAHINYTGYGDTTFNVDGTLQTGKVIFIPAGPVGNVVVSTQAVYATAYNVSSNTETDPSTIATTSKNWATLTDTTLSPPLTVTNRGVGLATGPWSGNQWIARAGFNFTVQPGWDLVAEHDEWIAQRITYRRASDISSIDVFNVRGYVRRRNGANNNPTYVDFPFAVEGTSSVVECTVFVFDGPAYNAFSIPTSPVYSEPKSFYSFDQFENRNWMDSLEPLPP